MSDECEILVYGGINIDLVTRSETFPAPGQTILGNEFITYPGGKGANQAVGISRMGLRVSLIGCVGNDVFGPGLVQGLEEKGVGVAGVSIIEGKHSGVAVINIDDHAQNQIIQVHGANANAEDELAMQLMEETPSLKYLLIQLETPISVSASLAKKAKLKGGTVILDPGPTRPITDDLLQSVDVITPNETEAEYLTGIEVKDVESGFSAAHKISSMGIQHVIVKMGAQGALYVGKNCGFHVPAIKVNPLDSVAAGDAFNGALTFAMFNGWALEDSLRWAVCAGGIATTRSGAQDSMPTRDEVEKAFRENFS
ncbi:MAG: ribokinase [Dehalococcoidia bacterium]|jgi:ribokinase|nr:ribokinase [Dehalococcoidia bacterium]|tara:strand:- start:1940 stop:2872 length:933 start_codon:yes stop_codon:yes gene_type:complete